MRSAAAEDASRGNAAGRLAYRLCPRCHATITSPYAHDCAACGAPFARAGGGCGA